MDDNQSKKKYFAFKGIPPRPTFNQDMTEEEGNILRQNVAYWAKQSGTIFVGAVSGTDGYGFVVVELENEDEARAIVANTPCEKAGLMKTEIYPMMMFMHR
jgi:hypothetical protein